MLPLLVPIGLGLIGGYLSKDNNTKIFAKGGDIDSLPQNESLRYFLLNQVSSGMIANKIPYSDYKSINQIRYAAVQILDRDGDRKYSIKSFNDLIQEALLEYEENKSEYAKGGTFKRAKKEYIKEVDAYKWFIVDLENKKAEQGFEEKEDAMAELKDNDYDKNKYKVINESSLKKYGIENPKEKWKNS